MTNRQAFTTIKTQQYTAVSQKHKNDQAAHAVTTVNSETVIDKRFLKPVCRLSYVIVAPHSTGLKHRSAPLCRLGDLMVRLLIILAQFTLLPGLV